MTFEWDPKEVEKNLQKPKGGFFVGCSPEGLMALGTVAFFGDRTNVLINGNTYDLIVIKRNEEGEQAEDGQYLDTFFPILKGVEQDVQIWKALVNPEGSNEVGQETVTLKNFGTSPVSIGGWKIAGPNGDASERYFLIPNYTLQPNEDKEFKLTRQGNELAQLRNREGSIKLYDFDGRVLDEQKYTTPQARAEGVEIQF